MEKVQAYFKSWTMRDWIIVGALILLAALSQQWWDNQTPDFTSPVPVEFQTLHLGSFTLDTAVFLTSYLWAFLAVFSVRRFGSATIVATLGAILYLILGNKTVYGSSLILQFGVVKGLVFDVSYHYVFKRWNMTYVMVTAMFLSFVETAGGLFTNAFTDAGLLPVGTPKNLDTLDSLMARAWTSAAFSAFMIFGIICVGAWAYGYAQAFMSEQVETDVQASAPVTA